MFTVVRSFTKLCKMQLFKSPINFRPSYNLLQNSGRLKTKPKTQEVSIPFIEKEDFQSESGVTLYRLEKAFVELKEFETRITSIERSSENEGQDDKLVVNITEIGTFQLYTDVTQRILFYHSPISGLFKYYYDKNTEMWKSTKDQHFLVEHLSREISKCCLAYLNL